jgi:two-component system LytT family response regulator
LRTKNIAEKTLSNFLLKYTQDVEIIGFAKTVSEGIQKVQNLQIDLLFLDIDLPDGNGFEVLKALGKQAPKTIFVTAYNQYAIKAFQVSAIDYLLKPVDPELLVSAVEKAKSKVENNQLSHDILKDNLEKKTINKLALPTQKGIQMVYIQDIIRIEADGNYVSITLTNGKNLVISKPIKTFNEWLSDQNFYRIHHSHLINIQHIKEYRKGEGGTVIMENGDEVEVSRRRKEGFLHKLMQ